MDGTLNHTRTRSVKERILSVAQDLFAEQGFAATSVRAIAEGVGVTVPALYYHFGSKRGIMLALVQDHCSRRQAQVLAALEGTGSCADRLREALAAYSRLMAAESPTATVVHRDPSLFADVELRGIVFAAERVLADRLGAVIAQGMAAGEFRPLEPGQVSLLLLAAARAAHFSRPQWGSAYDPDELAATLNELVLGGLLRRPRTSRE